MDMLCWRHTSGQIWEQPAIVNLDPPSLRTLDLSWNKINYNIELLELPSSLHI